MTPTWVCASRAARDRAAPADGQLFDLEDAIYGAIRAGSDRLRLCDCILHGRLQRGGFDLLALFYIEPQTVNHRGA